MISRSGGNPSPSPSILPERLAEPMVPISREQLPAGRDWGFQLKWDGIRMLARFQGSGTGADAPSDIAMFSRKLLPLNIRYPQAAEQLRHTAAQIGGNCLADGELIWWDGARPLFQRILGQGTGQPPLASSPAASGLELPGERNGCFAASNQGKPCFAYILFDMLEESGQSLLHLPYAERYQRLSERFAVLDPAERCFVTDLFDDGEALWSWVSASRWEGVVSKRLSAEYRPGKKHQDSYKKKTALLLDVDIVGLKWREQRVASLIMASDGRYIGSVSLGLTAAMRQVLADTFKASLSPAAPCPFPRLPEDLKHEQVQWLPVTFRCRVTGLELTVSGQLRHPKIVTFLSKEPSS